MGDRICVMNAGEIIQTDEPLALYNQPKTLFTAGFIGSPPMNLFRGTLRGNGDAVQFIEAGNNGSALTLVLPDALTRRARGRLDRAVVFGVRPEDVHHAPADIGGASAEVKVDLAEPMGAETFLHLTTGATSFIARVGSNDRHRTGETVRIKFNLDRAHLFDAETEQVLV
jgi:multiple sugar transport system ATP-binding protein